MISSFVWIIRYLIATYVNIRRNSCKKLICTFQMKFSSSYRQNYRKRTVGAENVQDDWFFEFNLKVQRIFKFCPRDHYVNTNWLTFRSLPIQSQYHRAKSKKTFHIDGTWQFSKTICKNLRFFGRMLQPANQRCNMRPKNRVLLWLDLTFCELIILHARIQWERRLWGRWVTRELCFEERELIL